MLLQVDRHSKLQIYISLRQTRIEIATPFSSILSEVQLLISGRRLIKTKVLKSKAIVRILNFVHTMTKYIN